MNPLAVSVIFVICSIMLSFLKNLFFSDQDPSPTPQFHKVLQLTNNRVEPAHKYYKSLYEAYNKFEALDAEKVAALVPNRSLFDQRVLSQSLRNQEISIMCGPDFLVLVLSGVSVDEAGQTEWMNTLYIYRLPTVTKINEINLTGRLILPHQCKRTNEPDLSYQLGVVSRDEFVLLKIAEGEGENGYKVEIGSRKDRWRSGGTVSIDVYDFCGEWVVYWSKERPWIVYVENIGYGSYYSQTIQINILSESNETGKNISRQQLHVNYVLLSNSPNPQLAVIFTQHKFSSPIKNITLSTYSIDNGHYTKIRRSVIDQHPTSFDRKISDCMLYASPGTGKFQLSCLVLTGDTNLLQFVCYKDVFGHGDGLGEGEGEGMEVGEGEKEKQEEEGDWMDDFFFTANDADEDEDEGYGKISTQTEQQPGKNSTKYQKFYFTIQNPSLSHRKLLKPSFPDPILYYQKQHSHFLFGFKFPQTLELQLSVPYLLYELTPPAPESQSQTGTGAGKHILLRDIQWVEEEGLVVVLWDTGIEVYQYVKVEPGVDGEGVAMAVILPFIELFATVFCLLRIIWNE